MSENNNQQIGSGSLTMFTLCAVVILDTLAASAAMGPSAFAWWGIMLAGFILPYTLVVTELGTAWPAEGGIYEWVKRAFGQRMAARTSFLYWINVGLWMPSVYILFAGTFSSLYWPQMSLYWQIMLCLMLTWLTVGFCNISTSVCLKIARWGAWAKITVIVVLGLAGVHYLAKHGLANHFQAERFIPRLDESTRFLPAIIYSLLGLELVASMGKLIKKPETTLPLAMLTSALLISLLYLFGTFGLLAALPLKEINVVSGIIDAMKIIFGGGGMSQVMLHVLCALTLFSFISNMVTWTSGSSRTAAEAAKSGELPACLGKISSRYQTPVGANVATGIISTLVIICYSQLANDNSELFWVIFSFSSCIFLLPYLFLFSGWFWLRYQAPHAYRPYRVPGGMVGQWLVTITCLLFIIQGIVLFIFPDLFKGNINARHSLPIIAGIIATLIAGECCLLQYERKMQDSRSKF
ncbi:APC family permease [Erwinia sp. DT-104]|uniref:APC family permease n=1 Tax=Erwinia sp. DT-104 TaxID=3396161 RepID=UPI003F1C69B2